MWPKILAVVGIILAIVIVLRLLKASVKWILRFVINAVVGLAILYLLNFIPGIDVKLNWVTAIVTGIFGVPAAVLFVIVSYFL